MHGIVTHAIGRNGLWRGNVHSLKFESLNVVPIVAFRWASRPFISMQAQ